MARRLLSTAAVVLATGTILFFFSERVFWSFFRPGDTAADLLAAWAAYGLLGWIFLDLVQRSRAAAFPAVFLCGAVFGWLAEGVVVDTLYGDPSNPLPLSVSFTGLAWHALLTVGVGWYLTGRALAEEGPGRAAVIALATGLAWGLWAVWWPNELTPPADTSPAAFAGHAFPLSAPLMAAWAVLGRVRAEDFPRRRGPALVLWTLAALLFLAVRVRSRPEALAVLPPLLLACGWALRRNARAETRPDALAALLGRVRPRNLLVLPLMPLTAAAVYAAFARLGLHPPTNVVLYLLTVPLGFGAFAYSLRVLGRRPPARELPPAGLPGIPRG